MAEILSSSSVLVLLQLRLLVGQLQLKNAKKEPSTMYLQYNCSTEKKISTHSPFHSSVEIAFTFLVASIEHFDLILQYKTRLIH